MNWIALQNSEALAKIREESETSSVLIFKHSSRCPVSSMALNRLERSWEDEQMSKFKPYLLDLIAYRGISNQVAEEFGVEHQSPQVIVIKDGRAIYNASHMGITYRTLTSLV